MKTSWVYAGGWRKSNTFALSPNSSWSIHFNSFQWIIYKTETETYKQINYPELIAFALISSPLSFLLLLIFYQVTINCIVARLVPAMSLNNGHYFFYATGLVVIVFALSYYIQFISKRKEITSGILPHEVFIGGTSGKLFSGSNITETAKHGRVESFLFILFILLCLRTSSPNLHRQEGEEF